jgi:hypothetical protein
MRAHGRIRHGGRRWGGRSRRASTPPRPPLRQRIGGSRRRVPTSGSGLRGHRLLPPGRLPARRLPRLDVRCLRPAEHRSRAHHAAHPAGGRHARCRRRGLSAHRAEQRDQHCAIGLSHPRRPPGTRVGEFHQPAGRRTDLRARRATGGGAPPRQARPRADGLPRRHAGDMAGTGGCRADERGLERGVRCLHPAKQRHGGRLRVGGGADDECARERGGDPAGDGGDDRGSADGGRRSGGTLGDARDSGCGLHIRGHTGGRSDDFDANYRLLRRGDYCGDPGRGRPYRPRCAPSRPVRRA